MPVGCFTKVSQALQDILSKFVYCRNCTAYENFKLKLYNRAQSRALGAHTEFQLEILTINVISGIVYFREIILESSRNISETTPWSSNESQKLDCKTGWKKNILHNYARNPFYISSRRMISLKSVISVFSYSCAEHPPGWPDVVIAITTSGVQVCQSSHHTVNSLLLTCWIFLKIIKDIVTFWIISWILLDLCRWN